MLREYVRKRVIEFIENEIIFWIDNMSITKEEYNKRGMKFAGSKDDIYYSHIISAYEFLLMHAQRYNF